MDYNKEGQHIQGMETAIKKGLDFLFQRQLSYGEFATYLAVDRNMQSECLDVSSVYITTFILYSIGFISNEIVGEITHKGLNFIKEEMESDGIWRFFAINRDVRYVKGKWFEKYTRFGIIPDLDDTACASYCLGKSGVDLGANKGIFYKNCNEQGVFYTWLMDAAARKEYGEDTLYLVPPANDICIGVIANILLYLGENEYTLNSIKYVQDIVLRGLEEEKKTYFSDKLVIYYLISRAYFNGVSSLAEVKETIIKKITELQMEDGSFGSALSTAFAVCTLLNFGYRGCFIDRAVTYIEGEQMEDGSWKKDGFFQGYSLINMSKCFYGSEEMSTAICLEALVRWKKGI